MECSPYIARASARAAKWERQHRWQELFDAKWEALCSAGLEPAEAADKAEQLTDEEVYEQEAHRADMMNEERRIA